MKKKKQSRLERAIDFLSLVFKAGEDQSMYCSMENGHACAFNMIVGVGTEIEEDLTACPHINLLRAAVDRCQDQYVITQLSPEKLLLRSGDFHAYIPCLEPSALVTRCPDARMGVLGPAFMDAVRKVAGLSVVKSEVVVECSILLENGCVTGSNSGVIAQAWHGVAFPDGLILPRLSFNILNKIKKEIVAFGFSAETLTFYFTDDSWLLTKLYQTKWPDVECFLSSGGGDPVPEGFFDAVNKVSPFSTDGFVYVKGNEVSSHPPYVLGQGSGLKLTFEGNHAPRRYNAADLKRIAKHVEQWDETTDERGTYFYGENYRGIIYHAIFGEQPNTLGSDEDIPF